VEGNIELAIQDNGVGFDPEAVGDTSHFGLQSMRERAEACGGVFVLESHLNVGTKIMVRIPTITRKP
jgi:two-component system sensor histidine kinase DegS